MKSPGVFVSALGERRRANVQRSTGKAGGRFVGQAPRPPTGLADHPNWQARDCMCECCLMSAEIPAGTHLYVSMFVQNNIVDIQRYLT